VIELRRAGFDVAHKRVDMPETMRQALEKQTWDVILCDHAMPSFSSDRALALVRELGLDLPFIIVSGTIGEEHAVAAMRSGCHDYVLKNNLTRLAPAVQRELREVEVRRARKQAEEALARERNLLRAVVDNLPDDVFAKDTQSRFVFINSSCYRHLGEKTEEKLRGKTDVDILPHEKARQFFAEEQEIIRSGRPMINREARINLPPDQPRWMLSTKVPWRDADGDVVGLVGINRDITERKQGEQEKEQMQAQLLQAQKLESLGVLAGGIAHDFNNLLTIINGNAQYLRTVLSLEPDYDRALQDIETAALHATDMTQALQAFSRPAKPQVRHADANDLVKEVYRLLRRMMPATIEFQLDLDPSPCGIAVDPGQVEQVLVNLCVNARDAMAAGGRLEIRTHRVQPGALPAHAKDESPCDGYAQITVSDTGSGMDAETLRRAFDPFFTTKPKDRGTGLGLAIVYRIVQAHSGIVDVASEPGKGTRFDVFFPIDERRPADTVEQAIPSARRHERILIVEDEEMIASLLKALLGSRGYEVAVATRPEQALELARRPAPPFNLAIVDYAMPGVTGGRCLADVRQARPDLKTILVTGYELDQADLAGAQCRIVRKPFTVPAIARAVREVLDNNL